MLEKIYIQNTESGAIFNEDRTHRYTLWRRFKPGAKLENMIAFICLNPSTADETKNDPTVTRCINRAKEYGYDGFIMLNAFSYRATDPNEMKAQGVNASGDPENMTAILWTAKRVGMTVCGWSNHCQFRNRSRDLRHMLIKHAIPAHHLSLNKTGEPKHPLYIGYDHKPERWF